jgi:hypothetical protein
MDEWRRFDVGGVHKVEEQEEED